MADRILLIDDDDLLRETISGLLEASGYDVDSAEDGAEGLRMFEAQEYGLIITDIMMPDRDGIEIIRMLHDEGDPPKIVAISGGGMFDSLSYLQMAKEFGADIVLEKPFRAQQLLDAVQGLLDSSGPAPAE
jgi:DNA-binding response OmpR family regulator